jgi:hypothetical protein
VVAKVRERLEVNKQTMHIVNMERLNLKKLNALEVKKQYHAEFSNRLTVLEDLDTEVNTNRDWDSIRENIKIMNYYELKKHKPCSMKGTQNY